MGGIKKLAVKRLRRKTTGKLSRGVALLTISVVGSALMDTIVSVAGAIIESRERRQ